MSVLTSAKSEFAGGQCLPDEPGIGLKTQHLVELIEQQPEIGFVEVHAENYMVKGGARLAYLERVRECYPLSIHGVGASLGGLEPLNEQHLGALKALVDRYQPESFSEHLAWSSHQGHFMNDLLPLCYTEQSLNRVVEHVDQLQSFLGRQLLLENPSTYLQFSSSSIPETEFISEVVRRSGCGLLLDINNIFVSATNHGFDPKAYLLSLPLKVVGEIHLAGFALDPLADGEHLLIDSHDADVSDDVWQLYDFALSLLGPKPTLLERDGKVPSLDCLVSEAQLAAQYLNKHQRSEDSRRVS